MSTVAAQSSTAQKLAAICGEQYVTAQAPAIQGVTPAVEASPASEEELAEVMRLAWTDGLGVVPFGGGTNQEIGAPPAQADILLRTHRLEQVAHFDPGDLTIGVGAGARAAAVQEKVRAHGEMLALDPLFPESTIGGMLATAWTGPLKHAHGGARDFCIGVRFVTADGKIAKAGGRVVKNVAGYDLMKLLIGSLGTLAVITAANFKLFPAPRQTATFVCEFETLGQAISLRDRMLKSQLTPMCLELVSPYAHGALTGGAQDGDRWRVLVRAGGSDAVVARYRQELGVDVTREVGSDSEPAMWAHLAQFASVALERGHNSAVLKLEVPIQAVQATVKAAEHAALDNNFLPAIVGRAGCGSLMLALLPIAVDPPGVNQYVNAISSLRTALPRDGSAIVLRCPAEARRHIALWGSTPSDERTMQAIKQAFDSKNILNRGRFLF